MQASSSFWRSAFGITIRGWWHGIRIFDAQGAEHCANDAVSAECSRVTLGVKLEDRVQACCRSGCAFAAPMHRQGTKLCLTGPHSSLEL